MHAREGHIVLDVPALKQEKGIPFPSKYPLHIICDRRHEVSKVRSLRALGQTDQYLGVTLESEVKMIAGYFTGFLKGLETA